jgi:hypothetical protein
MLFLLLFMLLTGGIFFLLNFYARKKTGIKEAIFYFKCEENAWVAETAWLDGVTNRVCKIVTTSNWQDGVISVLTDGETIYHTKQPCNDRQGLQRFHKIARTRFFYQLKWKAFLSTRTNADVAY